MSTNAIIEGLYLCVTNNLFLQTFFVQHFLIFVVITNDHHHSLAVSIGKGKTKSEKKTSVPFGPNISIHPSIHSILVYICEHVQYARQPFLVAHSKKKIINMKHNIYVAWVIALLLLLYMTTILVNVKIIVIILGSFDKTKKKKKKKILIVKKRTKERKKYSDKTDLICITKKRHKNDIVSLYF